MDDRDLRAGRSILSRRGFLGGAAAAAVTAILAACGGSSATDTPKAAATTAATAASGAATTAPTKAVAATTTSGSAASGSTSATTASGSAASGAATSGNPTKKTGDTTAKYAGPAIEKGGTLKILMWSHYVPAFDTDYFDKWAADWGTKNGLKVTVDHVPTATVVTKAAADIAIKGGHDLTQLQEATTPHLYADNLIDVSATANYLDKKYGGFIAAAKQTGQVNGVWKAVPDFVIPYPAI